MAKLKLKYRTLGKKVGDVIEVTDKETADRLVNSGTAVRVTEKKPDAKG